MSPAHHESVFGSAIVRAMVARGWETASSSDYRPELGLDTAQLFTFIGATQAEAWNELLAFYGGDVAEAQRGFAQRVNQAISRNGLVHVLRQGVKDRGVHFRLAYFKPSLVLSDSILDNYRKNRLTVVRELEYATKRPDKGNRLDLTLFLNGIPAATAELKNPLTGQGTEQAMAQYRTSRDPSEPIFAKRVVANFAVDPDLVFVATRLRGAKTRFLPFNTGSNGPGRAGGAGNPTASTPGTYATSYLWEEVWEPDNWLDLLERFVHMETDTPPNERKAKKLIFPRFHQWDAVRKLTAHASRHGAGHNYLVMASAGSGKSNTIAWLAHRLSSLHTPVAPGDLAPGALESGVTPASPVFDKIIVVTDRRNLDAQLRETIGNFEQTRGLVVPVQEGHESKSGQLAQALSSESGKIITVTLHTFPALLDYLRREPTEIKGHRFAIIVDEAHSSQSGDAATAVRKALRDLGLDPDSDDQGATRADASAHTDDEAWLKENARARGRSSNLSYFAFTATPKQKTLELFGTLTEIDGKPTHVPFHTYSMRQAIEEGFILDPLRSYVTYDTYWELVNKNPRDPSVDPKKANPLLARFAVTHESTVAQHARVIAEHFKAHTSGRLGGRAKAMVVTASRHSAVQMSRALKKYLSEQGRGDIGVLVAFSGTLTYDDQEVTESKENGGMAESALPKEFAYTRADDPAARSAGASRPEYRILVVADKYQTGFDQPLLTTMYVNKKLGGISAVQTLSRLNRTADRKSQDDLAVIDFVNDAHDIQEAFQPYYEEAVTLPTDPNLLYATQDRVMAAELLYTDEMRELAATYRTAEDQAAGSSEAWQRLHAELYRLTDPARERFAELLDGEEADVDKAEQFRSDLGDYLRKYAFLAQVVPYQDPDLECLYLYGSFLIRRLPRSQDGGLDISEVELGALRVDHTGEWDVSLSPEGPATLPGMGDGSRSPAEAEESPLSEVIKQFNERFGTEFDESDFLRPYEETVRDPRVQEAGISNDSVEAFGHVFNEVFEEKVYDHVSITADLGKRFFAAESDFRDEVIQSACGMAWQMIRRTKGLDDVT
ncbi:type I restriction endonuclease subunit R [Nocardiopsis alba]|uniref:type I restriction endonuclease subunit R n=1 Tax=Nocardiopsis alba TaxID=53437 RepID=UPI003D70A519